ncbi:MAG TPA: hypothetical protein VHS56_01915 [Candidatus Cybelea sp.]|jgi:hypothetical protein|nr:hypothetical protein [Candidatus Cybelea sp.]
MEKALMSYLLFESSPWLLPVVMIVVLGVAIEAPALWGKRLISGLQVPDSAWNLIQGGVLTLVAFMLGISFSQSQARFDTRRQLVVTEANAIGTTWLRADQLPTRDAQSFRAILTGYAATRLRLYEGLLSRPQLDQALAKSDAAQTELWGIASSMLRREPQNLGRSLLMTTLNDTIDLSAEQLNALTHHVPTAVDGLTLALVLLGALLIGFGFARANANVRILAGVYVIASIMVITAMVDLDRPQKGLVRVSLDPLVIQVQSMEKGP